MYVPDPLKFPMPKEVEQFFEDEEKRAEEWRVLGSSWHVSQEGVKKFQEHYNYILPLANAGNAWAQYSLAIIYMGNLLRSTEEEAIKHHHEDVLQMSSWLEKAAKQGFVVAVDNLISSGVGEEAERLKKIYKELKDSKIKLEPSKFPAQEFEYAEKVMEIAYGISVQDVIK